MKKEILICDTCGYSIDKSNKDKKWWEEIQPLTISFKNVPTVQCELFNGDICHKCAAKLADDIKISLTKLKESKIC